MTDQILIMDDNPDNLTLLELTLKTKGFIVHKALDYATAVSIFDREQIKLAFLDLELPEEDYDGLDLAQKIRNEGTGCVLIMLSANDNIGPVEKARRLGVNMYIVKPFALPTIMGIVDKYANGLLTATKPMEVIRR